ncbi:MAG TPA: hypothetical protein VGE55_14010 [Limnobacter sp.]|uniref:hypothetical protein n=1 Tax=Limnobacter sp. TaxID=2003368 RepID=UPI002EDA9041
MRAQICNALIGFVGLLSVNGAFAEPQTDLTYQSAFEEFDSYQPTQRRDWRTANDHVGKLGGWKYYAKEAASRGEEGSREEPSVAPETSQGVKNSRPSMKHDMSQMKGMSMEHGMGAGESPQGRQQ